MAKFKYVARLRNGREVTRNSDRVYTHHWRAWTLEPGGGGDSGFARSYELASKATASAITLLRKRLGPLALIESEIVEAHAVVVSA